MIYLDNASTMVVDDLDGNPSSLHAMGRKANDTLNFYRKKIVELLKGKDDATVVFTSGATEANNLAIMGMFEYLVKNNKYSIIVSCIEHPSVLECVKQLEGGGFNILYMPVCFDGTVDIQELERIIEENDDVGLVSIQSVNNEIGSVQPLKRIGALCKKHGIIFHTDATQAIGNIDINISDFNINMLSFSGHKFGADKYVGGLYVDDVNMLCPIIYGGGQEYGLVSGTQNVSAISKMYFFISMAINKLETRSKCIAELRSYFMDCLNKYMSVKYYVNCETGIPNILSLTISGVNANNLALMLDDENIFISTGSACHSRMMEPSYVLKSIGVCGNDLFSTIRVSFSIYNNKKELKTAAKAIADYSSRLYELDKVSVNGGDYDEVECW